MGTFANFDPETVSPSTFVTLTDERDGNNYTVVKIGTRWIMGQNLNYQGTTGIPSSTLTWQERSKSPSTTTGQNTALIGSFWCPGASGSTFSVRSSCDVYGALYSWETAMSLDGKGTWTEVAAYNIGAANATNSQYNHGRTASSGTVTGGRGICPPNWHVPTDNEWGIIFDAIEGSGSVHQTAGENAYGPNAGKLAKSACTGTATDTNPYWADDATNRGTDAYGFRALPTGRRQPNGSSIIERGTAGGYWSSSANSSSDSWARKFYHSSATVLRFRHPRSIGGGIRCIRNQ
jgi:uncharacterized protein (TIGR02145 family)